MPLRARRRARHFDVPVHDMSLRITGPVELYEEARAVGMQFWEQLQSYVIRNPDFQRSKRPLNVKGDAPAIVQVMATLAARAGVGPMFTFQGALTQSVGMALARSIPEITVACGHDHYILARKRARLALDGRLGRHGALGIVVKPELGPHGVHISAGGEGGRFDQEGVVIVASSCILAEAAAAGVSAILGKSNALRNALGYLQAMEGIHGGMIVRGDRIGVAGSLELAA